LDLEKFCTAEATHKITQGH